MAILLGEAHYERRSQIFHSFQRGICALLLGGEIDGAKTPSALFLTHTHHHTLYLLHPYSHALPLVYMCMCMCMCMCTYVHIIFVLHELSSALVAPYILPFLLHLFFLFLFTCFVTACAMLHIPLYLSHSVFLIVAENLHDTLSARKSTQSS